MDLSRPFKWKICISKRIYLELAIIIHDEFHRQKINHQSFEKHMRKANNKTSQTGNYCRLFPNKNQTWQEYLFAQQLALKIGSDAKASVLSVRTRICHDSNAQPFKRQSNCLARHIDRNATHTSRLITLLTLPRKKINLQHVFCPNSF
jgi:hypothetical protein